MKWFFIQSLLGLLAAFAIGIPIGYLIWRLQYRRMRTFDMAMGAGGVGTLGAVATRGTLERASGAGDAGGGIPVFDAPSKVALGAVTPSAAMLDRLRVEHAAELARHRTSLQDREAAIADLRAQLEKSRKEIAERDSRLAAIASDSMRPNDPSAKVDPETKLQALAEQRDAARAGLAKALADYETRLAALRSEHEQELKSFRAEHATAVERLNLDAENRINEIRSERESVAQALQQANGDFDEQRSALQQRHEAALSDLRKRAERAESELSAARSDLEAQRSDVAKRTAAFEAEREATQSELAGARKSLDDVQTALQRARAEIADAASVREALQRDLTDASAKMEQAQAELANARKELESAKATLDETRSISERHRLASDESRLELSAVQATLSEVRAQQAALQASHDDLVRQERAVRESLSSQDADTATESAVATPGSGPISRLAMALDPDGVDPEGVVDDLERIEGIGPRISASLQAVGIRTFERLAATPEARLREALARAGLNLAPSLPTWSQQAKFLAVGDEKSFRDFVERLVAGREAK